MFFAAVAVAALFGLWWFTRTRELFVVSVRHGRVLVLRGRVPAGLLTDIRIAVTRPSVARGTIKAMRSERGGKLAFTGDIDEGRQQQLRNIFALYPLSKLRCAPVIARPTLGQTLGIAWLAWLLDRSRG
jgi:hypothetical protein